MAGQTQDAKPLQEKSYTYYVFDNLRANQDHAGGNVLRYSSLSEALFAYKVIQAIHPEWTIALGGSINRTHEIDYVQRRGGSDNCLITDYQKLDAFKDDPRVLKDIETAMIDLRVDWQVDHDLTGNSILVPQEFGVLPLDSYLSNMVPRPIDPENVLTCVQEAYVEGEGWISLHELKELASFSNAELPHPPKVTSFNIAYEMRDLASNRSGYVDVSPSDFRIMKQIYQDLTREAPASEKTTKGRWRDMLDEAKMQAAARNLARPNKHHSKAHELGR